MSMQTLVAKLKLSVAASCFVALTGVTLGADSAGPGNSLTSANVTGEKARVWQDSQGRNVTLTLVAFDGVTATFQRSNGNSVSVKLGYLSAADQDYLRQHYLTAVKSQKSEKLPASVTFQPAGLAGEKARAWTNRQGRVANLTLVGFDGSVARFQKENGRCGESPVADLSAADQEYLRLHYPMTAVEQPKPSTKATIRLVSYAPPVKPTLEAVQKAVDKALSDNSMKTRLASVAAGPAKPVTEDGGKFVLTIPANPTATETAKEEMKKDIRATVAEFLELPAAEAKDFHFEVQLSSGAAPSGDGSGSGTPAQVQAGPEVPPVTGTPVTPSTAAGVGCCTPAVAMPNCCTPAACQPARP